MKDRLAFVPKDNKVVDKMEINFKKSPHKFIQYDSPQQPQDLPSRGPYPYTSNFREFDHIKKVPDETASLRQTMNSKYFSKLQSNHLLQLQEEKGNKLNDFLRQTMSYKTTKAYSETLIPDYAYSGQLYDKNIEREQKNKNNRRYENYHAQPGRRGTDLINESKSLKQYERLNDKINRNKQLIEQLRKTTNKDAKEGKDFLKNVNHYKSPTFIHLDNKKQKDELGFQKTNKQEGNYLTPKLDKANYQSRFNSSPLIDIGKSKQKNHEEPTVGSLTSISSIKRKVSAVMPSNNLLIDQFYLDKKLGEGKFGCVNLVRHKKTYGLFALKKVPKALIKSNLMIDQLALQIRIQMCLKNGNILEMYGFFDDKTHLYIVLEYMEAGTLYQKLKKEKVQEKEAAAIIRQITLAIDYLHDIGIAHRDIKPQNIVISNNVYKLCDFGWAAICNQRRKTYCGTFDYVAPQILQGVEYDMTVDLWCLGVLTYEVLTGKAPFYHISRKETMKKILNVQNQTLLYPEGMSETARDFIDKLIRKNPAERIKASEALVHPFLDVKDDYN